jgi:hypothetical protein
LPLGRIWKPRKDLVAVAVFDQVFVPVLLKPEHIRKKLSRGEVPAHAVSSRLTRNGVPCIILMKIGQQDAVLPSKIGEF